MVKVIYGTTWKEISLNSNFQCKVEPLRWSWILSFSYIRPYWEEGQTGGAKLLWTRHHCTVGHTSGAAVNSTSARSPHHPENTSNLRSPPLFSSHTYCLSQHSCLCFLQMLIKSISFHRHINPDQTHNAEIMPSLSLVIPFSRSIRSLLPRETRSSILSVPTGFKCLVSTELCHSSKYAHYCS